jgi:hypothetical protein
MFPRPHLVRFVPGLTWVLGRGVSGFSQFSLNSHAQVFSPDTESLGFCKTLILNCSTHTNIGTGDHNDDLENDTVRKTHRQDPSAGDLFRPILVYVGGPQEYLSRQISARGSDLASTTPLKDLGIRISSEDRSEYTSVLAW